MAFNDKINTSIHGRRLGLQFLTSAQSGAGATPGNVDYLVGPAAFRAQVTTAPSTATNLKAHGTNILAVSSVASSQVYTLDPPVPGVPVVIAGSTVDFAYVKTANGETIQTSGGSTFNTVKMSTLVFGFELIALTTAIWLGRGLSTAAGFGLTTST